MDCEQEDIMVCCEDLIKAQALAAEDLVLNGQSLTLENVEQVALGRQIALDARSLQHCRHSRAVVDRVLDGGHAVYGINTGFGRLATTGIPRDQVEQLQRNLILSHSSGVGEYMPDAVVRAMISLRVNALLRGYSGCRVELLEALAALLKAGILPRVPSHGSVGASGDLAPLSHVALGLIGEGKVSFRGEIVPAAQALAQAGLKPFVLGAKEGLALINGTQFMCSVGSLALMRAQRLLLVADVAGAMTTEAIRGTDASLHPMIHAVRPHQGQIDSAANLRALLKNSPMVASHKNCGKVQDPYSLRCMPQVHGAAREGWRFAASLLTTDINSTTDNPLVVDDAGEDLIVSGGNFHGAPVALALDAAAIAMSYIGTISERRCDKLLAGNDDLPAFLVKNPGLNSGLMIVQYAAASLVNENKVLCHPASVDTVPTSAGQEDHNSHGPTAAHKLTRIVDNLERILACELVCAAQALEFRRPLTFGPGTEAALACLRQEIATYDHDRPPYVDIEKARQLIRRGAILQAVRQAVPGLV